MIPTLLRLTRNNIDVIMAIGLTIAIVLAPAGLPVWVILAMVFAIVYSAMAYRRAKAADERSAELEDAVEYLEEGVRAIIHDLTAPQGVKLVLVQRQPEPVRLDGRLN